MLARTVIFANRAIVRKTVVFCEKCRAGVDVIVTVRLPDSAPERFAGQTGRVTPVCLRQARLTPLAWLYGAKEWY